MKRIKNLIKKIPFVKKFVSQAVTAKNFSGSANYWEQRYAAGGNSGSGSYNRLAEFKAEILNDFVKENNIASVIEFGCGDGNQLSLAKYPVYFGLDVSKKALEICRDKFRSDKTKFFFHYDTLAFDSNDDLHKAELSLSLDVIYHLVEDEIFEKYMHHLFGAAGKFVIIFSSNYHEEFTFYETDRNFTRWVATHINGWQLVKEIPNRYKYDAADPDNTSRADFYIYKKIS